MTRQILAEVPTHAYSANWCSMTACFCLINAKSCCDIESQILETRHSLSSLERFNVSEVHLNRSPLEVRSLRTPCRSLGYRPLLNEVVPMIPVLGCYVNLAQMFDLA